MATDPAWQLFVTGSLYIPDPTAPGGRRRVVFQRTGAKYGNLKPKGGRGHQQRAHVIPYDPKTAHQQALRARIADATAGWHALTENQRQTYRDRAAPLPYTGFNLWIKEWCQTHFIDPADYATTPQQIATTSQLRLLGNPANLAAAHTTKTTLNLAQFN